METVNTIKERIKELIQAKGLTSARFADIIGVQRSGISHILSGRNKPSLDVLEKILISFPDISGDWLITGNGDMLKPGKKNEAKSGQLFPDENENSPEIKEPENINREEDRPFYGKKPEAQKEKITETQQVVDKNSAKKENKEIEKIVVFYTDQTFREYNPE